MEADRRRQARRQLAASAYKRRLQQIERECNAELARVRSSAACLEPLNRIVNAWTNNAPEDVSHTDIAFLMHNWQRSLVTLFLDTFFLK